MVSENTGIFQLLKPYTLTKKHGIVSVDMFDIEGSGNRIIEAIKNPENRHSEEVTQFAMQRTADRYVRYHTGFIIAASKGDDAVLEFIKNFEL